MNQKNKPSRGYKKIKLTLLLSVAVIYSVISNNFYIFVMESIKRIPIEPLPQEQCASQPFIQKINIKGERHSGTKLVRTLLEQNVKHRKRNKIGNDEFNDGWKHGFLPPEGWGRPYEPSELLLVVTRDVFTWLPKMFHEGYDSEMERLERNRRVPFHEFLKSPYYAGVHPQHVGKSNKPKISPYQKVFEESEKVKHLTEKVWKSRGHRRSNVYIGEEAANVIKIRTDKYKNWLSDNPAPESYSKESTKETFLNNRIHIRMEDLVDSSVHEDAAYRQLSGLIKPVLRHCVVMNSYLSPILFKVKHFSKAKKTVHDPDAERKEMLAYYSKQELEFVLSQLDMEFEKKLGYNYDYVYELLKSDDVPLRPEDLPEKQKQIKSYGHAIKFKNSIRFHI